jgi:hypothetical protein
VHGGQSAAGRQPATPRGLFCELFRQNRCFQLEATFVLRTVRALSSRLRMAVLPTGKGTRGYPTLLGNSKGIEFYPRVRVQV